MTLVKLINNLKIKLSFCLCSIPVILLLPIDTLSQPHHLVPNAPSFTCDMIMTINTYTWAKNRFVLNNVLFAETTWYFDMGKLISIVPLTDGFDSLSPEAMESTND